MKEPNKFSNFLHQRSFGSNGHMTKDCIMLREEISRRDLVRGGGGERDLCIVRLHLNDWIPLEMNL